MVAEAGQRTGLSRPGAWACLVAGAALVLLAVVRSPSYQPTAASSLVQAPAVLEHEAREILTALGYPTAGRDHLGFFEPDPSYIRFVRRTGSWDPLERSQPAAYRFWYRQSDTDLVRLDPSQLDQRRTNPPLASPGMVELSVDTEGRLLSLTAVPGASANEPLGDRAADLGATDWGALFRAAGLEEGDFQRVETGWIPPFFADQRAAWRGVYPAAPEIPLRLEAASVRGQVSAFRTLGPWDLGRQPGTSGARRLQLPLLFPAAQLLSGVAATLLALSNLRRRRADVKTAWRLGAVVFVARSAQLLAAKHFASSAELALLQSHLAEALYQATLVALYYLAVEPFARRIWPRMFTSWIRLADGKLRDPLVGRDLLLGGLAGIVFAQVRITGGSLLHPWVGEGPRRLLRQPWTEGVALGGVPETFAAIAGQLWLGGAFLFGMAALIVFLRVWTGRTWLAVTVTSIVGILGAMPSPESPDRAVFLILFPLTMITGWVVLLRIGILSFVTIQVTMRALLFIPLTNDPSSWYFGSTLVTVAVLMGILGWGFYHSLGGHPFGSGSDADSAPIWT